ncbi:MAG: nuclease-related domain-containing protein [Candidatus Izemoplasmatales bacterium]|nr:nuclease-related domain-containing protein [Candidatus Izemoplasmatales bacterium]
MGRKRNRVRREEGIAFFLIVAVAVVVSFLKNNWETVIIVLYSIGGVSVISFGVVIFLKLRNKSSLKKNYISSDYYKETGIPYSSTLEERGIKFEIDCYNKVRQAVGPQYPMITDILVPQYNAINKDSQIDLILFHINGIFVIEMKNYSGPLIGSIDEERWVPYLPKKRKGRKGSFEDIYEKNWALYDRSSGVWKPLNPVKQNAKHIDTLQTIIPSEYMNVVILSDSMFISTDSTKSMIKNVMSLEDFIRLVQTGTPIFHLDEIYELYKRIKEVDRCKDPRAKLLHIARVKSIEQARSRKH